MKNIPVIFFLFIMKISFAQTTIPITTHKTSSLIFPYSIKHVDRGTRDILVQQVKEADNILLLKAATEGFPETNLTVFTSDGSTYDFIVRYENQPPVFKYFLSPQSSVSIETYANSILVSPKTQRGIKAAKYNITAVISGIYIHGNQIYYKLQLQNKSPINYDIDYMRMYIRDKRLTKRTAVQENEIRPIYIAGNISNVKAHNGSALVIAFEKFTLPDAKFLAVEINEKNGGRHLQLRIKNRKIMRAEILPDLH